jgi:hypothetical protein
VAAADDDAELDAAMEQMHGHADRAQEARRVEHMRSVVGGRTVACGYTSRTVAAMAAELGEIDGQEGR